MKYVITGSLGNIGLPVTKALLKAEHDVTVITSKQQNVAAIEALGAKAAVGSVEDVDFLTKIFAGANAVYTMVPPKFWCNRMEEMDWKYWQKLC
jgi:nucleoside-diphosphate-sugar epimerase